MVPVLAPAGLGMWQIGVALLSGVSAKEVVVSSFAVLFGVSNANSATGMATIVANIIGIIIGVLLSYGFFRLVITSLFGYKYSVSVLGIGIGMVVSVLILCGSVYLPLRGLKQDVAADLATGGG